MRTSQIIATLASAALANAQWWGGAPGCAASCMSSYWSDSTAWPTPTSYCAAATAPPVGGCISSACQATPTAWASYSSLSSKRCSQWAECTASGASAVHTLTATKDTTWAGGWWDGKDWNGKDWNGKDWNGKDWNGKDWNGKDWADKWKSGSSTGKWWPMERGAPTALTSGQVFTVTGCDWNDGYWGGPWGWGAGKAGPWGWGAGWTAKTTSTEYVTRTYSSNGAAYTTTQHATVGVAVSGGVTTTGTIGLVKAQSTGTSDAGRNAAQGVKVMGAVLGGVVGVAALL